MPQNEKKYTYLGKIFSKFHKKITQKCLLKPLAAGTLALFMGIGTLCGVLTTSIGAAQTAISNNENLEISSPLGLDPNNDPVVYETSSGIQIKTSQASISNPNLQNYTYFTMGTYSGTPVNWIIIGYNSNFSNGYIGGSGPRGTLLSPVANGYSWGSTVDSSPAGLAIQNETFELSSNAKPDTNLSNKYLLLFSETVLGTHSAPQGCFIYGGMKYSSNVTNLESAMETLYQSGLGFTNQQKTAIQEYTLNCAMWYWSIYGGSSFIVDTVSAHLFPLASVSISNEANVTGQQFGIENFLISDNSRIAYLHGTTTPKGYFTRTGYGTGNSSEYYTCVDSAGTIITPRTNSTSLTYGIRPAMVIDLSLL